MARHAFDAAERELASGAAAQASHGHEQGRFGAVGLYWLTGLVRLARGDEAGAMQAFERELSFERSGHLYARESCASTWYAIGAVRLRARDNAGAHAAFDEALRLVAGHLFATVAKTALAGGSAASPPAEQALNASRLRGAAVDAAIGSALDATLHGDATRAAQLVGSALTAAAPGSAGWLIPVEPMLRVAAHPEAWTSVLARLRSRAA